tara:strand:+ start:590 stop:736 length:147 start_codon:yes stop_codon:yes gene_type:complete
VHKKKRGKHPATEKLKITMLSFLDFMSRSSVSEKFRKDNNKKGKFKFI